MRNEDIVRSRDGLVGLLDIRITEATPERCEAVMPITDAIRQPFGFVHGGATLALLETAASRAAELRANLDAERPFGTRMDVRHLKPGRAGSVRGVAELDRVEGVKQIWRVTAYDDAGDVMSTGTFETRIVTLEYLAQKDAARAAQAAAARADT